MGLKAASRGSCGLFIFLSCATASPTQSDNLLSAGSLTASQLAQFPGLPRHQHPTVAIIGFSKCGTTTVAHNLNKTFHSDLVNVPVTKEVGTLITDCNDACMWDYQQNSLRAKKGKPFTYDASPVYVMTPDPALRNLNRANPEAGLILLMREPVARVRSAYRYFSRPEDRFQPFRNVPHDTIVDLLTFELNAMEASPSAMAALGVLLDRGTDAPAAAVALAALKEPIGTYNSPILGSMYVPQLLLWRERLVSDVGYTLIVNSDAYFGEEEKFFESVLYPYIFGGPDAPGLSDEQQRRRRDVLNRWEPSRYSRPDYYGPEHNYTPELACRVQRFFEPVVRRVRELLLEFHAESKGRTFIYPSPVEETWWGDATDYCGAIDGSRAGD